MERCHEQPGIRGEGSSPAPSRPAHLRATRGRKARRDQRKAAEKQQQLLMAELNHRVKNTLTLVLSILGRTREESVDEFKKSFSARIHALAPTHNLLSNNSWNGLSIAEVAHTELAPYVQGTRDRVKLAGPKIILKPRAAIALGLIFHELASNAAKYGALSSEAGEVGMTAFASFPGEPVMVEWSGSRANEARVWTYHNYAKPHVLARRIGKVGFPSRWRAVSHPDRP